MGILAANADERVKDVRIGGDTLSVDLMDGRTITVPLLWYPRLANATPDQLARWGIAGAGEPTDANYPLGNPEPDSPMCPMHNEPSPPDIYEGSKTVGECTRT